MEQRASVATLIRLKYNINPSAATDPLFADTPAIIWTIVEPGLAITAANLITIRPLLRKTCFLDFEAPVVKTSQGGPRSGFFAGESAGREERNRLSLLAPLG